MQLVHYGHPCNAIEMLKYFPKSAVTIHGMRSKL